MAFVSMREMLSAGVHFGHQTRYWSPKMAPYIFGARSKIHIINLEKTQPLLDEAMNYLGSAAANGKTILFVGTKRAARDKVAKYAQDCGMPYVNHRWLGGMLTNFTTVRKSVERLLHLEAMFEGDKFADLTKKERQRLARELEKLQRSLGGIKHMKRRPDVLFVIDTGYESIAVAEARRLGIPVVGVVDSNNDPDGIDYVIPGNDDSSRAVELYLSAASEAIRQAKLVVPGQQGDEFVEVDEESA